MARNAASKSASGQVVRLHEATGSSTTGWPAAVNDALRRAKPDVPAAVAVDVVRQWADIASGKVTRFHVTVRIAWKQHLQAPPPEAPLARGKRTRR